MTKSVNYKEFVYALGRKGLMQCLGLDITKDRGGITLRPVNTRGIGVGFIQIPIKEVDKVIEALKQVRDAVD